VVRSYLTMSQLYDSLMRDRSITQIVGIQIMGASAEKFVLSQLPHVMKEAIEALKEYNITEQHIFEYIDRIYTSPIFDPVTGKCQSDSDMKDNYISEQLYDKYNGQIIPGTNLTIYQLCEDCNDNGFIIGMVVGSIKLGDSISSLPIKTIMETSKNVYNDLIKLQFVSPIVGLYSHEQRYSCHKYNFS
jgi:hypothetical protein